jgi:indolepyruvate ferredoxin oxidoreductase beta subunit
MNIVIVAVGGQGALFAARVIGAVALKQNLDVKVSEVHGMSQRGGNVVTHVRYGEHIASPIVEEGYADIVIAMEMLEGVRAAPFLKSTGTMIINEQTINPMSVAAGKMSYPKDIVPKLTALGLGVYSIDALTMACEAGSNKTVNSVLLGAMAHFTGIRSDAWTSAITSLAPAHYSTMNKNAFDKGYAAIKATIQ